MKKSFLFLVCIFFASFCFFACQKSYFFEKKIEITNQVWTYRDSLNFDFSIQDTSRIYNLYIDIEHGTNYPMQNLYLMTHTRFPTGQRPKQRINIDLADSAGKWQGEGSGEQRTLRINLQQGAYFNAIGKYTLTLEQFMRSDSLKGIKSLTFIVEDTKENRK